MSRTEAFDLKRTSENRLFTSFLHLTSPTDIVTIVDMKKLISYIAVMVVVFICGCTEPHKVQKGASIEGLKITDLIPPTTEKLPPAIRLKLLTFEVPRQNLLQMTSAFEALSKEDIKFVHRKAFDRNAFVAGIGNKEDWSLIGDELKAAKAKKISTSNIIVRDRTGYEIPVKEVLDDVSLIYTNVNSQVIQHDLFSGTISWRVKAGAAAQRKGSAVIMVEAISRTQNPTVISRAAGNEEFGLTVFRSLSMKLKMEEGQFLILAPQSTLAKAKTQTSRTMNLAELFFFSRGDFFTREQDAGSEKSDDGQYDIHQDIALAQIFLLVCTEVQN